jgi:hypothetical protein
MIIGILTPLLVNSTTRPIVAYTVSEMEPSFSQATLSANGVAATVHAAIYDAGRIIGFLSVDWCNFGHGFTPPVIDAATLAAIGSCATLVELALRPVGQ